MEVGERLRRIVTKTTEKGKGVNNTIKKKKGSERNGQITIKQEMKEGNSGGKEEKGSEHEGRKGDKGGRRKK